MLIEKAVGLCQLISDRCKETGESPLWDGPAIQLADILTELLAGVGRGDTPVVKQVADLYVFLIQHQNKAVESGDVSMVDEIRLVLETEAETWRMVCTQTQANPANLSNAKAEHPIQRRSPTEPLRNEDRISLAGSLNLQG
jgi:flagellar protein FliS